MFKQGASHSGRHFLAAKMLAATGDVEKVQTNLGHVCLGHSKRYLTVGKGQFDVHSGLQWHSDISNVVLDPSSSKKRSLSCD